MRRKATVIGFVAIGMALVQAGLAMAQARDERAGWSRVWTAAAQSTVKQPEPAPAKDEGSRVQDQEIVPAAAAKPTLVGSWLLTVKVPDNAPPFDSFNALWCLTGDGLLVSSAQGDITPTPFPSVTSAYGAWAKTTGRQYAASFVAIFYDVGTGNNLGMLKLNQSITLSDSGDEWSGPFKATALDPNGNVLGTLNGTAQAKRIKVEPIN